MKQGTLVKRKEDGGNPSNIIEQHAAHMNRRGFLGAAFQAIGLGFGVTMLSGCPGFRPPSDAYTLDPSLCDGLDVRHLLIYGPQGNPASATALISVPGATGARSGRVSALGREADLDIENRFGLKILAIAIGVGLLAYKVGGSQKLLEDGNYLAVPVNKGQKQKTLAGGVQLWHPVLGRYVACTYHPRWGYLPPVGHPWYQRYCYFPHVDGGWSWSAVHIAPEAVVIGGALILGALLIHLLLSSNGDGDGDIPNAELTNLPLDEEYDLHIEVDGPGLLEHRYSDCGPFRTPGGGGTDPEPPVDLTPVVPRPGVTSVDCDDGNAPINPATGFDWNAFGLRGAGLADVEAITVLIALKNGNQYVMDVDPDSGIRGTDTGDEGHATITAFLKTGGQVVYGPLPFGYGVFGNCATA